METKKSTVRWPETEALNESVALGGVGVKKEIVVLLWVDLADAN